MTTAHRYTLGLLTITGISLLSLPLHALLLMYGAWGLTSHSTPASNGIWGCSQYPESCAEPEYYQTIIAAVIIVVFLVTLGWLGQRVACFPRHGLAIALLSLYSGAVIVLGTVGGFMLLRTY